MSRSLWWLVLVMGCSALSSCAEDSAGGAGPNAPLPPDTEAPRCALLTPLEGQSVNGLVPIEVEAEDNEGVRAVTIAIDGRPVIELAIAPWIWTWDTAGLAPGPYQITATAADAAGNRREATARVNLVASADGCQGARCAPTVSFLSPADGAAVSGGVPLLLEATDDRRVAQVRLLFEEDELATLEAPPWQATWNSDAVPEGPHTLRAVATDDEGFSAEAALSLIVDRTAPAVALTAPPEGSVTPGDLRWAARITEAGGVQSAQLLVDNEVFEDAEGPPWMGALDTSALESGPHTLTLRATDRAGQVGEDSVGFTLDRPPTVTFVSPAEGDTITGEALIEVDAADDLGLSQVVLLANGEEVGAFDEQGRLRWSPGALTGEVELRAVAIDERSQRGESRRVVTVSAEAVEVQIQRCAPACAPVEHGDALSGTVRLELRAAPAQARIAQVTWFFGPRALGASTAAPFALMLDTTQFGDAAVVLRAQALGPGLEATAERRVRISNCDRDQDGAQSLACGGGDCDDDDAQALPGAMDPLGDGIDQDCDGADGSDRDEDGFADAATGGDDCDDMDPAIFPCPGDPRGVCADRATDPDNCGACGEACASGLSCEGGVCLCDVPGCQPGDPEDYDFQVPGSWISQLIVPEDADQGDDLDGDGRLDNALGPTLIGLADTFQLDLNDGLALLIASDQLSLGATWPTLATGSVSEASGVTVDFFDLEDADNNPRTRDAWRARRDSFVPGFSTPKARLSGGVVRQGALETDGQGTFFLEIPFGFANLQLNVERAKLRGQLSRQAPGIRLQGARLTGVVDVQDVLDGFNDFAASSQCACLDLDEALIDLRRGRGGAACLRNVNTSACGDLQNPCAALAQLCPFLVPGIANGADIDTDGDGDDDAFSAVFLLEGAGAQIIGVEAP